ncbi:hypothetical protein GCM10014715_39110 [Streptomyces spiralis]|uniref:Uncharacterized protein n=1 Tax=Streptomyces spiralis TaxID=66376 RepID=A0A919DUS5_9ACTN|nr:hypothetical protein [Streptomyces spiralis]GHE79938.1 hypothetical protein GCM10014715_39110 [Streptomyces spiralis]
MTSSTTTDALAAPYALTTGHTADRLADILTEGPHLQHLLAERFGLDTGAAGEAAITVDQALTATWRMSGYGQDYRTWISCMPDVLLKCFVELAARAERDEFSTGHAVHIGRQLLTELALQLRPF